MRWNLSQNKKTEEFRGGNWVWKQSTIYLNVSLTQYALWYFSIVSKIPPVKHHMDCKVSLEPLALPSVLKIQPVKQHMDCNVFLEPLTLPSCAHNPGFAHNVHWPRIGHLAEGNDPWPNGQCQFLTFQCQCLKEFDGRFPIGQCRALIWTGLVEDSHTKIFIQCQIVRRLVRDGEDIWAADINFNQSNIWSLYQLSYRRRRRGWLGCCEASTDNLRRRFHRLQGFQE